MKVLILIFAVISSTFAITLNCQYSNYYFNEIGTIYACYQPTLSNILSTKEVTASTGTHQAGKSNADVRALFIYGQKELTYFPRGIEKIYPNLIGLIVINTNITTLNGDELNGFPNLKHFQFTANKNLVRVPGNLFTKNPLLVFMTFASNNIKHVGEKILDGLTSLRHASFAYNYCASTIADSTYPSISISALNDFLKKNCTDIQPTCSELSVNENVCKLQEQNQNLIVKNTAMEDKINQLVLSNVEINQKLDRLIMDTSIIAQIKELVVQIGRRLYI